MPYIIAMLKVRGRRVCSAAFHCYRVRSIFCVLARWFLNPRTSAQIRGKFCLWFSAIGGKGVDSWAILAIFGTFGDVGNLLKRSATTATKPAARKAPASTTAAPT